MFISLLFQCAFLPLALITLASARACVQSRHMWLILLSCQEDSVMYLFCGVILLGAESFLTPTKGSLLAKSSDVHSPAAWRFQTGLSPWQCFCTDIYFFLFLIIWKLFVKSILIAPKCSYYNYTEELGGGVEWGSM